MFQRIIALIATLGGLLAAAIVAVTAAPASAKCDIGGEEGQNCRSVYHIDWAEIDYFNFQVKCDNPMSPGNAVIRYLQAGDWTDGADVGERCDGAGTGVVAVKSQWSHRLWCQNNYNGNFFYAGHADQSWHNLGFPGTSPDWSCELVWTGLEQRAGKPIVLNGGSR